MQRIALLLALATPAVAADAPSLAVPASRVTDAADLLSPPVEALLTRGSAVLERRTGHRLVVVTVPSLGGQPIERYSLLLFNRWAIGRRGANDGIGLLVAPAEHRIRIEVGRGLERALTDAEAQAIIDTRIVPAFRAGRFDQGVLRGAAAIIREVDKT